MASVFGVDTRMARAANVAPRTLRGRPWRSFTPDAPAHHPAPEVARTAPIPSLAAIVEGEIIPRLMLAHGLGGRTPPDMATRAQRDAGAVNAGDVESFAPLTLRLEAGALMLRVDALLARGVSGEAILVDLLAPAARQLGIWWEEDHCDFVEVTMGLWRLQEVVRELCMRTPVPGGRGTSRRALFAAMPGDQHGFGTLLIDEMFRRAGWASDVAIDASVSDLLEEAGRTSLDLIGLTVSCDCNIARLTSIILSLRSVSRNPQVRVMVGGRVFVEDPALATAVGADGTAIDARAAVVVADRLVDAVSREVTVCG